LVHYRHHALASGIGVAVASAVLSGSLIAGGSVQATVRKRAITRLGTMTHAVTAPRPFTRVLAERLKRAAGAKQAVPVLMLNGVVSHPDTGVTVPRVQVLGVPREFLSFYPQDRYPLVEGRRVLISETLARDIGLMSGDLILSLTRAEAAPAASLFARRRLSEKLRTFRVECAGTVPQEGPGGFSLAVETGARRTLIANYDWLTDVAGMSGMAHAILLQMPHGTSAGLDEALLSAVEPEDLGLIVGDDPDGVIVRSRSLTLPSGVVSGLTASAANLGATVQSASVMLVTDLSLQRRPRSAHYLMAAHVPEVPVADGQVVLSEWAAQDLGAQPGDLIRTDWLEPSAEGTYPRRSALLKVARVIPTAAAAAKRWAVPDFEGVTDARRISDWDPPFPVNLRLITLRDEEYWARYRAAPRAFVSEAFMRRMWHGSMDWITALRMNLPAGQAAADQSQLPLERKRSILASALRHGGGISALLPSVRDLRAEAAVAAEGSSDFRGLMLGMSLFLVASAMGLAASLMQLSAHRRASQVGILLALGYRPYQAAAPLALEAAAVSWLAAAAGAPLGILIAAGLVQALNTYWSGAVAHETIQLTVAWTDIVAGGAAAAVLGCVAAWRVAWGLSGRDVRLLLSGWRALQVAETIADLGPARRNRWPAVLPMLFWTVLCGVGVPLLILSRSSATAYLSAGAVLLVGGLGVLHSALRNLLNQTVGGLGVRRLALRNAALHRRQSTLTAGMVAAAAFMVVTVAANVRSPAALDARDRASGAGGFDLVVRSTVPLPVTLETPAGREKLGFSREEERLFQHAEVFSLLVSEGVNAGCLNLARPTEPRVAGVPRRLIERGGFTVEPVPSNRANPWKRLEGEATEGAIPAFGDAESVRWILHSGLGRDLTRGTDGGPRRFRFVGLLRFSIFAGELLISEDRFRQIFPSVSGPSLFLIRAQREADVPAMAAALRRVLGEAGVEVRTTHEVLAELMAVQNTYLSAFLLLGGLGIVLGMGGLGTLLLRAALERRSELAILTAMGFERRFLHSLLIRESVGLLLYGAVLGTGSALLASIPRLASGDAAVNWPVTAAVLIGAVAAGIVSCYVAAGVALREDLAAWLSRE